MNTLASYQNGNTAVTIYSDGTKVRQYDGDPFVAHPESIDVKITDYCDMGCPYCHESSTIKGKHGDVFKLLDVLNDLPAGVELAIGGGNPLSHPDLIPFLQVLKMKGIIANITINQGHLKTYQDLLLRLINSEYVRGIGISITSRNYKHIMPIIKRTDNVVFHLIAGVNQVSILDELISLTPICKALVLGYKHFGFGVQYFSQEVLSTLKSWHRSLPRYVGKCTLSFDNLAIEQLKVRRLFTDKGWERFYMGDDFCYTMYIDAVKQQFAPTSRSNDRYSFSEYSLLEYFSTFSKTPASAPR